MVKISLFLVSVLLFFVNVYSDVVYRNDTSEPIARVISSNNDEVLIDFAVSQIDAVDEYFPEFGHGTRFHIPDDAMVSTESGMPNVPGIMVKVRIPDRGDVVIELTDSQRRLAGTYSVVPSQRPALISGYRFPYEINNEMYSRNEYYPQSQAVIVSCEILRDIRIARIIFYPVQVNPVTNEVVITTHASVKLSYRKTQGVNELAIVDKSLTRSFIPFYEDVLNFDAPIFSGFQQRAGVGCYVFIGSKATLAAVQDLVNWKIRKGYDVTCADIDSIGTTAAKLDAWIEQAFNTWPNKPEYMLLCGGENIVPTATKNKAECDNQFGVIGSGKYPSIHIGRITAKNDDVKNLTYQAWKIRMHEMEPFEGDNDWLVSGRTWGCRNPTGSIEANAVIAQNYKKNGFVSVIEDKENQGALTGSRLVEALSKGVSVISYIAHGLPTQWASAKISVSQLANLTNGRMMPWIWNIACTNSAFSGRYCFAEGWMCEGSIDDPKGAIGLVSYAPNATTASVPMFKEGQRAYFEKKELWHMGALVNYAKRYIKNSDQDLNGAIIWGCPEVDVFWTKKPLAKIQLQHTPLKQGTVTITATSDNNPIDGALIGIATTKYELLGSGYTNSLGKLTLTLPPFQADTVFVTATYHNCVPYLGKSVASALTVTSPDGGEIWKQNTEVAISWEDNFTDNVTIELLKAGKVVKKIAENIASSSPYQWEIDKTITDGKNYRIRIIHTQDSSVADESNKDFTINTVPQFSSTPVKEGFTGIKYVYQITATDGGDLSDLKFKASGNLPGWLSLTDNNNGTAALIGKPGIADTGEHSVSIFLTDGIIPDSEPVVQSFTISVEKLDAPAITKHPQDIKVNIGDQAVFTVEAEGKFLKYTWYKNNTQVSNAAEPAFEIDETKKEDNNAHIFCVVSNPAGNDTSDKATIELIITPIITPDKKIHVSNAFGLMAAPNPAVAPATVTFTLLNTKNHRGGSCSIYDAVGNIVYTCSIAPGIETFNWDITETSQRTVSAGTYAVIVTITPSYGGVEAAKTIIGIKD